MAIHWWHTERLRAELATDTLSESDSLKYMLLAAVLYVQANYTNLWFGAFRDWAFFFEAFLVLAVSLIGTHECFKANGGARGQAFLLRFCALAVPVGLKVAIFGTVVAQALYFGFPYVLTAIDARDPALIYRFVSFILPPAWAFIYYWRIAYHLSRFAPHSPLNGPAA